MEEREKEKNMHECSLERNKYDPISRRQSLEAVRNLQTYKLSEDDDMLLVDKAAVQTELMMLPPVQPEQQHGRVFKGIVVEYLSYKTYPEYNGKPYFSIKYTENGQEFIGYGTYKPEVLSEYLKEYFMPPTQPEIIRCKDCMFTDGKKPIADGRYWCVPHGCFMDYCSRAERRSE